MLRNQDKTLIVMIDVLEFIFSKTTEYASPFLVHRKSIGTCHQLVIPAHGGIQIYRKPIMSDVG